MQHVATSVLATAVILSQGLFPATASAQQAALQPLAEQLSDKWLQPSQDIRMTVAWRQVGGSEFLHCRIENTSSHPLELNESLLPWNAPGLLVYTVLDAKGALIFHNWIVDEVVGSPRPHKLNAGQVLEGDIDLWRFSFYKAAAHEDLLMMWSGYITLYGGTALHGIPKWGGDAMPVSGITFLPKHE